MYIDHNLVPITYRDTIKRIIEQGGNGMTEKQFLEAEIRKWKGSPERLLMLTGEGYYTGKGHDILNRKRTAIGNDGKLMIVDNLPNNKIVDNQYGKGVDQKTDYLVGQPLTFKTEDSETGKKYAKALNAVFNEEFDRKLKTAGRHALNHGIGWLFPYIEDGALKFKTIPGYEVLPFWKDEAHTELDLAVRLYVIYGYIGMEPHEFQKVEIYSRNGVDFYDLSEDGILTEDYDSGVHADYLALSTADGQTKGYNWERIPLIPFKYNAGEIPLIQRAKTLQDAINTTWSDWLNGMQSTPYNEILVVKNYDGADLGELRRNLATYGAVKVRTVDGADGGVEALEVDVNASNYQMVIKELKKALIENMMGYDAKDDRMGGNANQMNIQSMYSDINQDANSMETEFQAAMAQLRWFVDIFLKNQGVGDFSAEKLEVIFNRDMLMDEASIMGTLNASGLQLSNRTLVAQVPFVDDVDAELEQIEKEKQANVEMYGGAFGAGGNNAATGSQDGQEPPEDKPEE